MTHPSSSSAHDVWPGHYDILGLPREASADDIRAAHRRLVRLLHPDVSGDTGRARERYHLLESAYATLKDPALREAYDRATTPPGGMGAAMERVARETVTSFLSALDPTTSTPRPQRGDDAEARLTLSFAAATRGGERDVELPLTVACETCDGHGGLSEPPPFTCHVCRGAGERRRPRLRRDTERLTCPFCAGTGRVYPRVCEDCDGTGQAVNERRLRLSIPPGTDDGALLRVAGRGAPGQAGGAPGDLIVHISVRSHPLLRRDGDDLLLDVPLRLSALVGASTVQLPTLEGIIEVPTPSFEECREPVRYPGHGVPRDGEETGALVVSYSVQVPTGPAAVAALSTLDAALAALPHPAYPAVSEYETVLAASPGEPEESDRADR